MEKRFTVKHVAICWQQSAEGTKCECTESKTKQNWLYDGKKHVRTYQKSWEETYPWLRYDPIVNYIIDTTETLKCVQTSNKSKGTTLWNKKKER